jgi:Ca-activated chloride channel family protein
MTPRRLPKIVATLAIVLVATPSGIAAEPPYAGRPLREVLAELEEGGLALVYSSDLVHPEMRVREEPTAGSIQGMLEELLRPHRLAPAIGPRGRILIVRSEARPIEVRFARPTPGELVTNRLEVALQVDADEPVDRVRILVDGEQEAVLTRPPFQTSVDLAAGDGVREVTAHVEGGWGGHGRASVETRQYQVTDSVELVLRQLFVTVQKSGRPLRGLTEEDFELVEDGARREIVTFGNGDEPLSAAVLLDLSGSMSGVRCELALAAAGAFLSRLGDADRAMLLAFSDRTLAVTPFRSSRDDLSAHPCPSPHASSTVLNDHLYAGLRLLDEESARRVVILITDGADVSSVLDMSDVLWKVEQSTATIYWIRVRDEGTTFGSAWRGVEDNRRQQELLERAVEVSGGTIVRLDDTSPIASAFDEILDDLRSQYVLGYYSDQGASGSPGKMRVFVDRLLVDVRLRETYRGD